MNPGSWLRRRKWWAVAGGSFLALYALFGFLVVPRIVSGQIQAQARTYLGREATTERVRFNPFTLALTLEGFRLADRDGGDLLTLDLLRIDLQVTGLFRRAWRFREIVAESPVVTFRIMADGRPSVADLMEPGAPSAEGDGAYQPPRLIVDRLAATSGKVEFSDASMEPPFEWGFTPLNVEIRDFITIPDEQGDHTVVVGVGDGAQVRWRGTQTVEPLRFTGRFDITEINLRRVWAYFGHDQPVEIAEGKAGVVLPYDVRRAPGGEFELSIQGASVDVRDLVARPRAGTEEWLRVPEVQGREIDIAWPAARAGIGSVRIAKPHALVRIEEAGRFNWAALLPPAAAGPESAPPAGAPGARPFDVRIGSVEIEGGSARYEDLTPEPDVAVDLTDVGLRAGPLSSDLTAQVPFDAAASVGGGTLRASGSVAPDPFEGEVDLDLAGLDLLPLRPYVELAGTRMASGVASLRGKGRISGAPPSIAFAGDGSIEDVEFLDALDERLLGCRRIGIQGLRLERPPIRVRIRALSLDEGFARIHIDPAGNLNLTTLTAPEAPAPSVPSTEPLKLEIGTVSLDDGSIDFADQSLILPFATKIHSASGTMHDLSTFGAAAATLALEGRVAETGFVKVGGSARLADPFASTDVEVHFRSLEMPTLTPYAATFAGYSIQHGLLDLDIRYRIEDRRLVGDHRLVASDLVLGDEVEGAEAPGLAVRLAVALLKDRNGRINLDVPIEGSVDSPEFAYRKVVWQAIKTILANVALAPFRAIGRLFGRDEEDLELVEFDPGRSDLLPAEQDKLGKIAGELGPRAELTLEVEGRFDPVSDAAAIRRMKLDAQIAERRATAAGSAPAGGQEASTLESILEALYAERFSAEALEAERRSFTPATPGPAPAPGAPAAPAPFDAPGFYEALRTKLLEGQPVTEGDLAGLGSARSATILAALTASGSLEPSRVKALDPVPVKRRKAGSERIASEMTMSAGRAAGDGGRGGR